MEVYRIDSFAAEPKYASMLSRGAKYTDFFNQYVRDFVFEDDKPKMYDEIGIWQTDGPSPVDTVAIVAYTLCTAVSDGMTGELVVADGGMSHNIVRFQPEIMQYPED